MEIYPIHLRKNRSDLTNKLKQHVEYMDKKNK